MAQRSTVKTTYTVHRSIQPIYSGGSVALGRDGRTLATCLGEDVLLTDITTGQELARVDGDGEAITALSLTPSASYLIVCSRSLSMRIYSLGWSIASGSAISVDLLRSLRPHPSPVVSLTVDSTGTMLATGGADGVVKVWDIRGGYATHTFHGHGGVVSALHLFQVDTSRPERVVSVKAKKRGDQGKTTESSMVGHSDQGSEFRLASGTEDGRIRIWNLHKRTATATLDAHVSVVRALAFSPTENMLVSASRDKTMVLWDARSWKMRRTIPVLESVESAGFLSEGSIVYSGGERGRLRLWSVAGGNELTEEQEAGQETEGIIDTKYFENLPYLLSIHADQTLAAHSLALLPDPALNRVTSPLPIIRRISGTHDEVIDLAYVGPDKNLLALATNSEDLRIISLQASASAGAREPVGGHHFGADVAFLKGHEDIIICIDVDWSGHWLVTGAKDNTARLWRLDPQHDSYISVATLTGHAESLGAIALPHSPPPSDSPAYADPLSHPPQFLITGSQDKTVKRWDISNVTKGPKTSLRATYTRKAHDKDINAIDINDGATLFASASQDRTVKIYSTETGDTLGVLRGHRRGVWTVRFSPRDVRSLFKLAGRGLVATGSGDKTVKIWSLVEYSCLLTLEGHTNSILRLVWLPSHPIDTQDKRGAQIATAAGDGLVKIWHVSSGEAMCTLDNHTDRVWALTINPSMNELVSGGGDSVVTFWKDITSATMEAAVTAETERVELDQRLQNFAYAGNYREAIILALQMNQPARLFNLFRAIVESEARDEKSLSGLSAVDEVLGNLVDTQLFALILRLRDWNTNARTSPVAQKILWAIAKSYPAARLAKLKPPAKVEANGTLRDILDALKVYSERHYRRMEELMDESYLLDFTLTEMDQTAGMEFTMDKASMLNHDHDVIMVE